MVIIGGEWGSVVRLGADGSINPDVGRIPGARKGVRLETGDGIVFPFWTREPAFVGFLNSAGWNFDSIEVPIHPWGERWVGSGVLLPGNRYAMAPLATTPQPSPAEWVGAPLVQVLSNDRSNAQSIGQLHYHGGRYLTWLLSNVWLGSAGDTLLILNRTEATLSAYAPWRTGMSLPRSG